MRWLVDLVYLVAAVATSPVWLVRMISTGKIRTDWRGRFGHVPASVGKDSTPRILIHAVSVGEVNATRSLIEALQADDRRVGVVVSTTTDTGFARARSLFSSTEVEVARYPFDFSWSVNRFLNRVRPDVVALMELEVWPNFTAACANRGIRIGVVNGRISERSHHRYRWVRPVLRRSFARLAFVAAQNSQYAQRFREMGVSSERVLVTDTMKWDTAQIASEVPGAAQLGKELGIDETKPLIVAGSTEPCEHRMLHQATPEGVQLLCAPRRPEWFDEAARHLPGCARRSLNVPGSPTGRFLLDTIGELRKAYALADVVVVGRSFGELFGSDMMEPIALGKATVVGPRVSDFQDAVDELLADDGLLQTTEERLALDLAVLLADPSRRFALAENGRTVIRKHQGASVRNSRVILDHLPRVHSSY